MPENISNISNILEIKEIKEIKQAGFVSYKKINSGTINQNFLVDTKQGQWVLRLNNPKVSGVNRQHEYFILETIKNLTVAPKIIANNVTKGYLLKVYEPQCTWSKQYCLQQQKILINQLKQIHQIDLANKLPDFESRLQKYYDDSAHLLNQKFKEKHHKIKLKLAKLGFFDVHKLIHFDLNRHNLIGNNPLVIIDWEFAGCGHPVFDLAVFIYNQKLELEQCEILIEYCSSFVNGSEILLLSLQLAQQMVFMWEIEKVNYCG